MNATFSFPELMGLGMKRGVAEFAWPEGYWLNLGAGRAPIPGSVSLDLPEWNGETDDIPEGDESVDAITAFHFFEHFTGPQAIRLLRECERVLRPGGTLTIVVPLAGTLLSFQDLDHKSFWTPDTFRLLFESETYDKHGMWRYRIHSVFIAGVVERNLAVFAQLVKT